MILVLALGGVARLWAVPGTIVATTIVAAPSDFAPEAPGAAATWNTFAERPVASMDASRYPLGGVVWYRLKLELTAESPRNDLWLRLSALHQRHTVAYLVVDGDVLAKAQAGYAAAPGERDLFASGFDLSLPLTAAPARGAEVWVRVEARVAPIFTPEIVTTRNMRAESLTSWSVALIYYGGVTFLSLVQLVLLLHFRDRVSLDYVLFSAGLCLGAVARLGHFDALFSGRLGGFMLGDYLLYVRLLNTVLGLRMLCSYFDLAKTIPWAHRTAVGLIACHVAVFVAAPFIGPGWVDTVTATVRLGVLAFAVTVGVRTIQLGLVGAKVTAVAWAGVIVADAALTLMLLGWLPRVTIAALLPIAGVLWEMLFNTFGLVYRFERVRDLRQIVEVKDAEARSFQRLVRVLCHDVSNPLSVIRFTLESLDPASQFGRRLPIAVAVRRMRRAESTITAIIRNVRALEALGLYPRGVPTQPVNLPVLVRQTLALFVEQLNAKSLHLECAFGSGPKWVQAEPNLLQHTVLANALSNAVKFSPAGGTITVAVRDDEPGWVRLEVRDRGAGLSPDVREAFARAEDVISRPGTAGETGTGFGLQLMRDYTGLMGGRFALESVAIDEAPARCGTTVIIRLRAAAPEAADADAGATGPSSRGEKLSGK